MRRLLPVFVLFTVNLYGQVRDVSQYERILLPIVPSTSVSGAFGSQWQTQLWLANDGDDSVDVFPIGQDCPVSFGCTLLVRPSPLPPRSVAYSPYDRRGVMTRLPLPATTGGFLYVQRSRRNDVSLKLQLRDMSRGARSFGTYIPVVPESGFFTGRRSILAVPVDPQSRIALRVYSPGEGGTVALRISEMVGHFDNVRWLPPRQFVETQLDFRYDRELDQCGFTISGCPAARYKPAAIEINDLLTRFPELLSTREGATGLRIEIEPITPDLTFWPMVTVTSNLTNEATLFLVR